MLINKGTESLINDLKLAIEYNLKQKKDLSKKYHSKSTLAFVYEKARNAIEYKDEHLIRYTATERILKRRLHLNQSSKKISAFLLKELNWARYIEQYEVNESNLLKIEKIIEKYKNTINTTVDSKTNQTLVGLCAAEIDESINFDPINQIIINYVASCFENLLVIEGLDKPTKSMQIYIATERAFAKNSEIIIKHKLLKVLLKDRNDPVKLIETLTIVDQHLNYEHGNLVRRKIVKLIPPFNLLKDYIKEHTDELIDLIEKPDELNLSLIGFLEVKYKENTDKVLRASKRSIVYIFLTKMLFALLIEVPFDILMGSINYLVLSINILFPPSLMILFNSQVKLPEKENSELVIERINSYLYADNQSSGAEKIEINKTKTKIEEVFYYIFIVTSGILLISIIYFLNILGFNPINQMIFMFFLSVVSFFAYRVREISNDFLLEETSNSSLIETLIDYLFLPIIKIGQWLSMQVSKINILSYIFDVIIEAPLKTFIEIFEQWLHFVRVKKEEFLG
ncbi:MAG: hypothetical protein QY322_02255 [bacterium]|nr:MAG: hypothetical protein QY322_02255 [bacterium]